MVLYTCFRCGYDTNMKSSMRLHLNRKNKCPHIVRDINVTEYSDDILNKKDFYETGSHPDLSIFHPVLSIFHPVLSHVEKIDKKFKCEHCTHSYNQKCHLTRHLKKCGENKMAHILKEKDKEIEELKQEAAAAHQTTINNNNNTTNNNNTIIFNIEANKSRNYFSKTDYSVISDINIRKAAVRAGSSIQEIVKFTHFDPQHPENQNIFISSLKSGLALIFEDDQWNVRQWGDVVDRLIDNGQITMDDWLRQDSNRTNYPVENAGVKRLHELRIGEDADFFAKRMDTQLKHVVYNNRTIPQSEASVKKLHQMTLDNPDF